MNLKYFVIAGLLMQYTHAFTQNLNFYKGFGTNYSLWLEGNMVYSMGCGGTNYVITDNITNYPGIQVGVMGELDLNQSFGIRLQPSINYYLKSMDLKANFTCLNIETWEGKNIFHNISLIIPLTIRVNPFKEKLFYCFTGGYLDVSFWQTNSGKMDYYYDENNGFGVYSNEITEERTLDNSILKRESLDYGIAFGLGTNIKVFSRNSPLEISYLLSLLNKEEPYIQYVDKGYLNSVFTISLFIALEYLFLTYSFAFVNG